MGRGGRESAGALAIIFALVLPGSAAQARSERALSETPEIRCAVPEGVRFTVEAERDRYLLGERIPLRFCVHNDGGRAIEIEAEEYPGFRGSAIDRQGRHAPLAELPSEIQGLSQQTLFTIPPRGDWCDWLILDRLVEIPGPGVWTLELWHDLGWTDATTEAEEQLEMRFEELVPSQSCEVIPEGVAPTRAIPRARTVLAIREPTPGEAREIVRQMSELPSGEVERLRLDADEAPEPTAHFEGLTHPAYRDALVDAIERGEERALQGLAAIQSMSATAAMVDLIDDPDLGEDAMIALADRVSSHGLWNEELKRRCVRAVRSAPAGQSKAAIVARNQIVYAFE